MRILALRTQRTGRRRLGTLALASLLGLGLLAGCSGSGGSGGSGDDSSGASGSNGGGMAQQDMAEKPAAGDRDASAVSPEQARAGVGQKLVRRANLQLKVDTLTTAAERIRTIASTQQGAVVSEELYSGADGRNTSGTITISVPSGSLDGTIALIEKV